MPMILEYLYITKSLNENLCIDSEVLCSDGPIPIRMHQQPWTGKDRIWSTFRKHK